MMLLQRTEKAHIELLPGPRSLGLRERRVLRLANGQRSLLELERLCGDEVWRIALNLVREGYLEPRSADRDHSPRPHSATSANRG